MKIRLTFYLSLFIVMLSGTFLIVAHAEQNSVSTAARNADDASTLERIENAAFMNVGISGAFGPEYDIAAAAGSEFGWFYETPRYAIGTELRFNIGDNYDAVFFSIGSRYFSTQRNISPYVGGGCSIGSFSIYSARFPTYNASVALGVYAVSGIEMFRFTPMRLKLEIRMDILHGSRVMPPPTTIGLLFALDTRRWF